MMDDSQTMEDGEGRMIDFKNTIIIMTSNLGSDIIHENFDNIKIAEFDAAAQKAKMELMELLKSTIRPEFLNRIDETIMFRPLTKNDVLKIVDIQLKYLTAKVSELR